MESEPLQTILARLAGVKQTGENQWQARCPAHDDRHASLSVSRGDDDRVLLHCHAGCAVMAICQVAGIRLRDLFPRKQDAGGRGRIVAAYDYRDAQGQLVYQVVRFEPKDFRQRRPDGNGGWTWKMGGVKRVLYRLPDLLAAAPADWIVVAEGEKDVDGLVGIGMVATTNPQGAGKWSKLSDDSALVGRRVAILPDRDQPGRDHALDVARRLCGKAAEVRIVELPGDGKDASDWIAAGGTREQLLALIEAAPRYVASADDPAQVSDRPKVLLPGGSVPILEAAGKLGALLAKTGLYYVRGGAVVTMDADDQGFPILSPVKPAAMASIFESVAHLMTLAKVDGQIVEVDTICSEQAAKVIMHAGTFLAALPPIRVLARCPVLIERDGKLVQVSGYDRQSGILALGEPAPDVPLDQARSMLHDMLDDFRFAMPSDRSRALAAIITPALVFGGLLRGRAPIDLGEADKSQTGKGFRNKLTASIYRHNVRTVTQRKGGGVGSMEETFNTALVQGMNFISLDNVRGNIDSPAIESFLTEDVYYARIPYHGSVQIDPRRVIVLMTSNKADITVDLANRSCCVNIHKRPEGYQFKEYPEGDIWEHVQANQPLYLGAVFAVVKAWFEAGRPMTSETRHDFRRWARTLDWIVQNVLGAPPLLDGHRETQLRMSNPALNWLRDVALAVRRADQLGKWLRAHALVEIIAGDGRIEIPGLSEDDDLVSEEVRRTVLQAVGRRMSICFGTDSARTIEGITIKRRETVDHLARPTKEYWFEIAGPSASSPSSPLCAPYAPAKRSAKEMAISPMSAGDRQHFLPAANSAQDGCGDDECIEMLPRSSGHSGNPEIHSGTHRGGSGEPIAETPPRLADDVDQQEVVEWRA
ncbi:MAG: hypothetical protein ACE15C_14820 [Phycisphaerae bacterium]